MNMIINMLKWLTYVMELLFASESLNVLSNRHLKRSTNRQHHSLNLLSRIIGTLNENCLTLTCRSRSRASCHARLSISLRSRSSSSHLTCPSLRELGFFKGLAGVQGLGFRV
eukprot:1191400-Prorocentrum_minimum.AAC.4